ncbi:hypothetical protein [Acaryochloris marina]|uniref:hypothetical protein n=1 Tax=Acaryochloris marina TaxID=155978 RepID=UPI0021C3F471|nr:hypothetical protein [Acaryochloris marina]BDM83861.1 hypothetical protein AM10699_67220 [Acaryochloris marina MBIC10699]
MNITITQSTRTNQSQPGFRIAQSPLISPFHAFHPVKDAEPCYNAYRQWLHEVVLCEKEPVRAAKRIAKQCGVLISTRYKGCSRDEILACLEELGNQTDLNIFVTSDHDPGRCIKSYLEWKYPAPEQQTLEVL